MSSQSRKKKGAAKAAATTGRQGIDLDAFDQALDHQLMEVTNLLRQHWHKNKDTFQMLSERTRQVEVANLELRQGANPARGEKPLAILQHQHQRSTKMLIKRDTELRDAEAENRGLREALAAEQAVRSSKSEPIYPPQPAALPGTPEVPDDQNGVYKRFNRAVDRLEVVNSERKVADVSNDALYQGLQLDKSRLEDIPKPSKPNNGRMSFNGSDEDDEEDEVAKEVKELEEKIKSQSKRLKRRGTKVLDMKERMKAMANASNNKKALIKDSGCCAKLVTHPLFDNISLFLILSNAIWLGVDAAWNTAESLVDAEVGFLIGENFFCFAFFVELLIRFGALKQTRYVLDDYWFLFDTFVVIVVALDTWVLYTIMVATGTGLKVLNPSVVRILRMLRLTRVARIIRLLKSFPEVMVLLRGLTVAIRSVLSTVSLLGITIYIFAIVFTQLTRGYPTGDEYFHFLSYSVNTLIFRVCFYDGLAKLGTDLFAENFIHGIMLMVFILIAPLTVMNMLVGVLVEVLRVVAAHETDNMAAQALNYTLEEILKDLDDDGDRRVNLDEFSKLLDKKSTVDALKEIGVDALELVESPDIIFRHEQELPFEEFMEAILLLRGSNVVTVKDVMQLRKYLMSEINQALDERLLKQMKVLT